MKLEPYIFFHGSCEEALNFYAKCFNGTIEGLSRFSEMPKEYQSGDASWNDKVMHASFVAGDLKFMASDGRPGPPNGEGEIALCVETETAADGDRVFNALAEGGNVEMPLAPAFWGGRFGQLVDRFGIHWMVNSN